MDNGKQQNDLLRNAELSIWLDSYNDIYSDFDPRPYPERTLSDDFIHEAKKMAKEKPDGKIELKLLIPSALHNKDTEAAIVKSLRSHFRHAAGSISAEKKKINQQGIGMTVVGFILMVSATYAAAYSTHAFYYNIIRVILEPAGWFMVWTGLDHLFYIARKRNPEYRFNGRMSHADIKFLTF